MDTSKVYIEMCTAAYELQDAWVPLPWDYIFCRVEHSVTCLLPASPAQVRNTHWLDGTVLRNAECCGSKREHVWLPRQDQIPAMMHTQKHRTSTFLLRFAKFSCYKPHASIEQLYVRYWMARHSKKTWVRGEWKHSLKEKYGQR
jgi:hypothetical protein